MNTRELERVINEITQPACQRIESISRSHVPINPEREIDVIEHDLTPAVQAEYATSIDRAQSTTSAQLHHLGAELASQSLATQEEHERGAPISKQVPTPQQSDQVVRHIEVNRSNVQQILSTEGVAKRNARTALITSVFMFILATVGLLFPIMISSGVMAEEIPLDPTKVALALALSLLMVGAGFALAFHKKSGLYRHTTLPTWLVAVLLALFLARYLGVQVSADPDLQDSFGRGWTNAILIASAVGIAAAAVFFDVSGGAALASYWAFRRRERDFTFARTYLEKVHAYQHLRESMAKTQTQRADPYLITQAIAERFVETISKALASTRDKVASIEAAKHMPPTGAPDEVIDVQLLKHGLRVCDEAAEALRALATSKRPERDRQRMGHFGEGAATHPPAPQPHPSSEDAPAQTSSAPE